MAIGRPTKRDPKLDEVACRARAMGMTHAACAHLYGVHKDTYRDWRRKDEDFSASLDQAYAEGIRNALAAVVAAWERDWKAAAWWVEKIAPHIIRQAVSTGDEDSDSETQTLARRLHKLKGDMRGSVPTEEAA